MDMFPVLFAIPRVSGWLAQWCEMLNDADQKIARPRQIFTGSPRRTTGNRNAVEISRAARAQNDGWECLRRVTPFFPLPVPGKVS